MARRSEPWHKLVLVLSGSIHVEQPPGVMRTFGEDHVVLIPASDEHRLIDAPGRPAVIVGLCLEARRLEVVCGYGWPTLARRLSAGLPVDQAGREALVQVVGALLAARTADAAVTTAAAWGGVLQMIALVARPPTHPAQSCSSVGVATALSWLDAHITQPISVGELAARAGLSYRAFTSQVRRSTGESVLERILRLRLDRSAALLASGMPVTNAALASGFGDLSGFYRHFRKRFGTTPKAWGRSSAQA
jgi:AraC-like DNA-binding protein